MHTLSNSLVKQFAKTVSPKNTNSKFSTTLGTLVKKGDIFYAKFDGSTFLTPVFMSVSGEENDRVLITIQNHSAMVTSNITSPGASRKNVTDVENTLTEFKDITVPKILTEYIKTKEIEAEIGKFNFLTADEAKLKYADIDLANVKNAWIDNGIIKDGSIGSGAIHDGAITNAKIADATIDSAKIKSVNADTITVGTLKTNRLIITGPDGQDSIVKAINIANGVSQAEVNGTKIQAASIDVADLSAFEATIAQFNISLNAIYSGKTSITDPVSGIYLSTTGLGMGDGALTGKNESPLQAYADGSFKLIGKNGLFNFNTVTGELDIDATSIKIGSKTVSANEDLEVGGRNLLRNSKTLIWKDYYFHSDSEQYLTDAEERILLDENSDILVA